MTWNTPFPNSLGVLTGVRIAYIARPAPQATQKKEMMKSLGR